MIWHKGKILFLCMMLLLYVGIGAGIKFAAVKGYVDPLSITDSKENDFSLHVKERLSAAQSFVDTALVEENWHVNLYFVTDRKNSAAQDDHTNSEAVSYYLLWNAIQGEKEKVDLMLQYIEQKMIHPDYGYLQWRLDEQDRALGEGTNIASDADLRVLQALFIAEEKWGEEKYAKLIDAISEGVTVVAVTEDTYLSPYGGISGRDDPWTTHEVWLSYMNFEAVKELSERKGNLWETIYQNMKEAVLNAQLENGLYNQHLTDERKYGNSLDDGGYSINSLWIMVRSAESNDPELQESARKALEFYKKKFQEEGIIYTSYSSNGDGLTSYDSPWVYALIGRTAIALKDKEFADQMISKLFEFQVMNISSPLYGAIPEDSTQARVGQFTMQESILTMQRYVQEFG